MKKFENPTIEAISLPKDMISTSTCLKYDPQCPNNCIRVCWYDCGVVI